MAINEKLLPVREVRTGYGVTSVQLNLNIERMHHLAWLRDRAAHASGYHNEVTLDDCRNLLSDIHRVLDFICQDISHPMDANLWKVESNT